jgi:hypothetical protein
VQPAQAAWSGAGGSHQLVWLSVLELDALAKQSTRPVQRLACVLLALQVPELHSGQGCNRPVQDLRLTPDAVNACAGRRA